MQWSRQRVRVGLKKGALKGVLVGTHGNFAQRRLHDRDVAAQTARQRPEEEHLPQRLGEAERNARKADAGDASKDDGPPTDPTAGATTRDVRRCSRSGGRGDVLGEATPLEDAQKLHERERRLAARTEA